MNVLITGGEQGLGAAIINHIRAFHPSATIHNIPGETVRKGKQRLDLEIEAAFDNFDLVINNYGINHLSRLGETGGDDAEIMDVNVLAPYWIMNALARKQAKHRTRIINIASQTYRVAQRTTALYCASKAALVQLSKVVAREMAPHWQVNCVAPGRIVGTSMDILTQKQVRELRGWEQEGADEYAKSMIPMGRFTDVNEVAAVVMKVAELPSYVTGTVIEAFGGV